MSACESVADVESKNEVTPVLRWEKDRIGYVWENGIEDS